MQVAHDCALVGHLPSIPFFARYRRTDGADVSEKQSGRANVCPQFCRTVDDTKKWGKEKEKCHEKESFGSSTGAGSGTVRQRIRPFLVGEDDWAALFGQLSFVEASQVGKDECAAQFGEIFFVKCSQSC